ncbi:MAG: sigma-54 dependent transcriptional regulator [Bdellovibrionota bacterium]
MGPYRKALKSQILIVDDNPKFVLEIKTTLSTDHNVTTALSAKSAMALMTTQGFDLILLDYEMPEFSGFEFLKLLKRRYPEIPVIMLTGKSDSETIIQTMQTGATDFVIKGSEDFEANLKFRIAQALDKIAIVKQNLKLTAKIEAQTKNIEIVGASRLAAKLKSEILALKGTSAFVLITGENGTGKELIARNLNAQEDDSSRPFIAVNCAALTPTLFESELFGHEKGAFTGAMDKKIGKFQAAEGGDIFLDEIAEIPTELQAKLLRVLQEKIITPVGSNKEIPIDVRVIAATNKNLEEEIARGNFREDLYYRLNNFTIYSPSLRERKDDILLLAEIFLKRKMPLFKFSESAKKALLSHSWLGNIRELGNAVERASIMARESRRPIITAEHLMLKTSEPRPTKTSLFVPAALLPKSECEISAVGLQGCINWIERNYLERSLELMKNDNHSVYTKIEMSKAHYFRRKKAIGLTQDQEKNTVSEVRV